MATYTMELGRMIQNGVTPRLNEYPIFDENYRDILNKKILDTYYFREIGFETPAKFNWYLNVTLTNIMPYYNQLYQSELLKINPLYTMDLSEKYTGTEDGTSNTTADSTGNTTQTGSNVVDNTSNQTTSNTSVTDGTNVSDRTQTTLTDGETSTDVTQHDTGGGTKTQTDQGITVGSIPPGDDVALAALTADTWASSANRKDYTVEDVTTTDMTITTGTTGTQDTTVTDTGNITTTDDTTVTDNGTLDATGKQTATDNSSTDSVFNNIMNGKTNKIEDYLKTLSGTMNISQSDLLMKYRQTFLNIDLLIIKDLNDLFIGVY